MSVFASVLFAAALAPTLVVWNADGFNRKKVVADASAELAKVIGRITDRIVAAMPEKDACPSDADTVVYVGGTEAAADAGLSAKDLPALGCRIVVRGRQVFVLARTATGAAYGVADFAERCLDTPFLTLDGDDPFVRRPDLALKDCDFTSVPSIYRRVVYTPDKYKEFPALKPQWFLRTLLLKVGLDEADMEGSERLSERTHSCHSQFDYLPPETYFRDHPEYYMLGKDGKRHGERNRRSHPCFTHPDVEEIVVSNMLAFIRKDREEHPHDPPCIYDFSQMDAAPDMCRCPNCAAVAAKHDAKGGRTDGGDAGLQLEFVNRVARRVRAEYPEVRIRIFAYVSTEVAPSDGLKPEDNVIVWLCDLYTNSDHEVPLVHPANARRLEILKGWAKLTRNIEIWDYMLYGDCHDLVGAHGDFPEVNVDAIAADAKLFRDLGVRRLFNEAEYRGQPFHELNLRAMGACYCDPDCDPGKVIADYCRVYGAAAPKMREAIDFIRRAQLATSAAQTERFRWHRRDLDWLTVANLAKARDLFAEAARLADTPAAKRRTAHALRSATHKLELVRKAEKGDAEYVFPSKALNCASGCRRVDDKDATDGTAIEVLVRKDGTVVPPKFPARMGVYDWDTKANQEFRFTPDSASRGYAWYELGSAELPPAGTLWLYENWGCTVDLRGCYATADGLPESYNRFTIFLRAKVSDGRFLIDKVRLVRNH